MTPHISSAWAMSVRKATPPQLRHLLRLRPLQHLLHHRHPPLRVQLLLSRPRLSDRLLLRHPKRLLLLRRHRPLRLQLLQSRPHRQLLPPCLRRHRPLR